jgi:antitoxin MazE
MFKHGDMMRTKVQKWGNSLAFRIPKVYADEIRIEANASIDMTMKDGALIITPVVENQSALEELLARVTEENIHHEWDTGPAEGEELW